MKNYNQPKSLAIIRVFFMLKSSAAEKTTPDLSEAPEGSALGVRPKGATTRNCPVRLGTAKLRAQALRLV